MSGALRALVLLLALSASAGAACSRSASRASDTTASTDSVRGVLTLVGSEPGTVLFIAAPAGGVDAVALTGAQVELLRRVVGLEIVITGRRTGQLVIGAAARGVAEFDVSQFVVRSAEDVAAHDGVVVGKTGAFLLRLADGQELPIASLPSSLRRMIGARVWLAGPLDAAPQSYGVIRDPR